MSLDHILLGSLREPATGYDLGREFHQGARHFWFAELSQIYPTLKRLEAKGWLKSREAPSERGPARRVYQTTARGRAALRRWLSAEPRIGHERLAYVAQAYFLDALDDADEADRVIRDMRSVWRQKLEHLEAGERRLVAEHGDWRHYPAELFHPYSALRLGIGQYRAKLAWCDETLERLATRTAGRTPAVRET